MRNVHGEKKGELEREYRNMKACGAIREIIRLSKRSNLLSVDFARLDSHYPDLEMQWREESLFSGNQNERNPTKESRCGDFKRSRTWT